MDTTATQYYAKAMANYPWELDEVIEALNYALSYDNEHAGAYCLLGRIYSEQLIDFEDAFYYFEQALLHNINYINTYYFYSMSLIQYGDFAKAEILLNHGMKVKGICKACLTQRFALIYEMQGKLLKAKKLLRKAIALSINNEEIEGFRSDLKRVKDKIGK